MDYKVGDKVMVFRPSKEELKKWDNSWVTEMNNFIGKEYTLSEISSSTICFFEDKNQWSFPPCILLGQPNIQPIYEIY